MYDSSYEIAVHETCVPQDALSNLIRDRPIEPGPVGDEGVKLPALAARIDGAGKCSEQVTVERPPHEFAIELGGVDADETGDESTVDESPRECRRVELPERKQRRPAAAGE